MMLSSSAMCLYLGLCVLLDFHCMKACKWFCITSLVPILLQANNFYVLHHIQDPLESLAPRGVDSQGILENLWPVQSLVISSGARIPGSQFIQVEDKELGAGNSTDILKELCLHLDIAEQEQEMKFVKENHVRLQQHEEQHEGLIVQNDSRYVIQDGTGEALTMVASLKDCTKQRDLQRGSKLHAHIIREGLLEKNVVIGNTLINMYAKCGALEKAHQMFENLPFPNVVSWNVLIAGYAQEEHGMGAITCYEQMQYEGFSPNAITFVCVLKACGSIGMIDKGQDLHAHILEEHLFYENNVVGNALVDMYVKCGAFEKAQSVFDELPFREVISWNALITGYVQHGYDQEALNCFEKMQLGGFSPNPVTFVCVLKACGSLGALDKGQELHDRIAKQQLLESNLNVASALVDMYAQCGALDKAQETFDNLPSRNVVVWNALIGGYVHHEQGARALMCYDQMQLEDIPPNAVTFACILKACGSIGALNKGQELHAQLARCQLVKENIHVGTALLDMHSKFGDLKKAKEVFDELQAPSTVSWNALATGYTQHGQDEQALNCFDHMQRKGYSPDATTFSTALKASGRIGAAYKGQQIHAQIVRHGLPEKDVVVGTALIDMYANCGMVAEAQEVYDKIASTVVSQSALMEGYCQLGKDEVVFSLFNKMIREATQPNIVTFTIMLNTCSHGGLLEEGEMYFEVIHNSYGIIPTLDHYACLIDLFGRAGQVEKALALIKVMPFSPNLTLWNTVLSACRHPGNMKLGQWAFEHAAQLGGNDAAAFVSINSILHG